MPSKVSKWVDVGVSFGAALVIWGALRKIIHAGDADIWLWIGLTTEALIFALYGVLYIKYPAVEDAAHSEEQLTVAGRMDKMMKDADINQDVLKKLGDSFKQLTTTVSNISSVTDAAAASSELASKTKAVSAELDKVKNAYSSAAESVTAFNSATEGARHFHEQIQVLTKNLSSLNTIYELELAESNNHLKALNKFYGQLAEASDSMVASTEDAKRVQEQIGTLAQNLGRLNNIYGSMLSAMQGR
ncbi:MAG: gliding motility protein GldL [Chitinophagaceae bacterium]|nr:gliding motility protein GldL [Chitinophagaceae bacterium]